MLTCNASDFINLSKDILSEGNLLRFRAKGWSMTPFIRDGDIVSVKPVSQKEIRIGDIVYYCREERAVLHRVIKKTNQDGKLFFATKGDASVETDGPIEPANIMGKVIAIEKNGKAIKLNSTPMRCINYLCAFFSPISYLTYPVFIKAKRWVAM